MLVQFVRLIPQKDVQQGLSLLFPVHVPCWCEPETKKGKESKWKWKTAVKETCCSPCELQFCGWPAGGSKEPSGCCSFSFGPQWTQKHPTAAQQGVYTWTFALASLIKTLKPSRWFEGVKTVKETRETNMKTSEQRWDTGVKGSISRLIC